MNDKLNQSIQDLWLTVKAATQSVYDREITPEEFFYLLGRYPFLEMCDSDYPYYKTHTPKIHEARSGWRILDFDSVLSASASELLQSSSITNKKHGTIVAQYTDTAFEMVELAIKKGWAAAELIDGYYPMQRMAWVAANENKYLLKGFSASMEDMIVNDWTSMLRKAAFYPLKARDELAINSDYQAPT